MDFQRKMLDELMGANRNVTAKEKPPPSLHWSDDDVRLLYFDYCVTYDRNQDLDLSKEHKV